MADTRRKRSPLRGLLVWGLVLGAFAALQWPMLKGTYYRRAKTEAPAASVEWRADFSRAQDEAKRTGKPVLVAFSAGWCPPCLVMKHEVWPDAEVGRAVNLNFVPVLVDVDDPRAAAVTEQYQVEGVPAVLVVGSDGQVLRRASYLSKAKAISFLTGA